MDDRSKPDIRFWFGFFMGGLIGALVLFFMGTKEGKVVRKKLVRKGEDLIDTMQDKLDDLKEKGQDLVTASEKIRAEVASTLEDRKGDLTADATKKLDSILEHIETVQDRGRRITANMRRSLARK